jgi:hypothetical protein
VFFAILLLYGSVLLRFVFSLWIVLLCGLAISTVSGQASETPQPGDPPVAALIAVSAPDDDGVVTISGEAGAVFPAAQVAIRNLYTEQLVYTTASLAGSFSASIYGPGNTPFWISPAPSIPAALRDRPGALPGGPGTIITGPPLEPPTMDYAITQLIINGDPTGWERYPAAELATGIHALVNNDSLYVAIEETIPPGVLLALILRFDDVTYELTVNPTLPQAALLRQLEPVPRDPSTRAVAVAVGAELVELRITLRDVAAPVDEVALEQVFLRIGDQVAKVNTIAQPVPFYDERDGIVYPGGPLSGDVTQFTVSGALAGGASTWTAQGRASTLNFAPGEPVVIELDASLSVPNLAASLTGLDLIGEIGLQPVTISRESGGSADHNVAALHSNNGWSNLMTPSGLAIDNLQGDVSLGTVTIPAAQVIRQDGHLLAGFRFTLELPPELPPGLYVPTFRGRTQVGDGDVFGWDDAGVLGQGAGAAPLSLTRLPLVLNVGEVSSARLLWMLFHDDSAGGSRGMLPEEDRERAALSNRVRFNSPTYVLPPGDYPLEPYLLNQLPNRYDMTAAPLLPLVFPGGELRASVTLPDGTLDQLSGVAIAQNRLSTEALDERELFGAQAPLNAYRLTTLDPAYTDYAFDQYGEYRIELTGTVEDIYGHRYEGGGTYRVMIAEPLELRPGVLPGTPFHVGDALFAGGRVSPGVPAEVAVRVTLFPLSGEPVTWEINGRADRYGYFAPEIEEALRFEVPGEYVIDYEARHVDDEGRLWAASQRGAGIITGGEGDLIAHGQRGLFGHDVFGPRADDYRPAWFTTARYPPRDAAPDGPLWPYFPYHSGDIVYAPDGVRPALTVQDRQGDYRDWLLRTISDYTSSAGIPLEWLAALHELPLLPVVSGSAAEYSPALFPGEIVNNAYAYISAVRPDVTVRQLVLGGDDPALPLHWDAADPYNRQIGAGVDGDRPGDYVFLFGGAVIRNAEAGINQTAAYAALAVVTEEGQPVRIVPPYRVAAGGPDGGPLLIARGAEIDALFHPTAIRPGQVLTAGERFSLAGQVAPTLESQLAVTVTSPAGERRGFTGVTSPTGYYYWPDHDFALDEIGVWTVRVEVTPAGSTSAGMPEPPLPVGGVPGAVDRTFRFYVVPQGAEALEWAGGGDVDTDFRPGTSYNFALSPPEDWSQVSAFLTVTTPSYVLRDEALPLVGAVVNYSFNPVALARDFPNLEFEGRGEGPSGSDVVTLTFVMTGIDAGGAFAIRTRTFTLFHDRMLSFEDFAGE